MSSCPKVEAPILKIAAKLGTSWAKKIVPGSNLKMSSNFFKAEKKIYLQLVAISVPSILVLLPMSWIFSVPKEICRN